MVLRYLIDLIFDFAFICDIMVDANGENSFFHFQSYHPSGVYPPVFGKERLNRLGYKTSEKSKIKMCIRNL